MTAVCLNRKKMKKVLKELHEGMFAPNKERGGAIEEKWIKDCVKNLNLLIIVSSVMASAIMCVSIIFSMVKRLTNSDSQQWELPFGEFTIFNPHQSPNFELVWLYQSIVFPLLAVAYLAADFLIISVFFHTTVQFKILRNSIERILPDNNYKMNEEKNSVVFQQTAITWQYLACKLKENVQYHLMIMGIAQKIEDAFSNVVLIVYVADMLILACIMYHCSLFSISDPRFQKDFMMTGATAFQLLLISYFGNEVTLESEKVLSSCFMDTFFDADIRLEKGLGMIMIRSLKPTKFSIGGFADLSLLSYVSMVKASFSYYTLLRSLQQ